MIYVAGYCRVSTDKEDQANSFEAQCRYFREYIQRNPQWQLYAIYADEGITGTSTKNRKQFNRMIGDARNRCFQLIITKEVSRFSRNILDTISYTRELKKLGIGVFFLTENLSSLDPASEMMLTFMATIAQEESRKTSVRVKWGQTRQMEQGVVFGSSLLGYRIDSGKLTVIPEEAEIVRIIFRKYVTERKSSTTIVKEMESSGYMTHTGSTKWSPGQIIRILRNEKYVGDLIQKKSITVDYLTHGRKRNTGEEELIIIKNHHAPIISRETWDMAQEILERKKRRSKSAGCSDQLVFSGKIKCGECGKFFVSRFKYLKSGKKIRRWGCYTAASRGSGSCKIGRILRDDVMRDMLKIALESVKYDQSRVIEDVLSAMSATSGEGERTELPKKKTEQMRNSKIKQKQSMLNAFFSGEISKEEMTQLKSDYDKGIQHLTVQLEHIRMADDPSDISIKESIKRIINGEVISEQFLKTLLESIIVYKGSALELHLAGHPGIFHFNQVKD